MHRLGNSYHVRTATEEEARRIVQGFAFNVRRSVGRLTVELLPPAGPMRNISVSGKGRITVPASLNLDINGVSGDLRILRCAGNLRVRTVSGNVFIDPAEKEVDCDTTSGNVTLLLKESTKVVDVSMSGGDVKVHVSPEMCATISVRCTSGEIYNHLKDAGYDVRLDVESKPGSKTARGELGGRVGGGGCTIQIQTVSGNVFFEPLTPAGTR